MKLTKNKQKNVSQQIKEKNYEKQNKLLQIMCSRVRAAN